MTKVILVTAALGDAKFKSAAKRIVAQSELSEIFDEIIVLTDENLNEYCPVGSNKYADFLNPEVPGFGYWVWKPELLLSVSRTNPNSIILWVDAGCEIHWNAISRKTFRRFVTRANDTGVFCYALDTPEARFSKRSVLEAINVNLINDFTAQIQATWFIFHSNKAAELITSWTEFALENISNINNDLYLERKDFVANRNDQSIFSVYCKTLGFLPTNYSTVDGRSIKSRIRGLLHPIWTSRNFSQDSLKSTGCIQKFRKSYAN